MDGRHIISRLKRFDLFLPTLIGIHFENIGTVVDIKHEEKYSHMSLHIDVYLDSGCVIEALFFDYAGRVKIFYNGDVLFNENYSDFLNHHHTNLTNKVDRNLRIAPRLY